MLRRLSALLGPIACLLFVAPASAAAPGEIALPGCSMTAGLAADLIEARDLGRKCAADTDCWRDGLARARAVRDRYPGEYDAHRAYVLDVRSARRVLGETSADAVAEEYRALAAAHPDNPAYAHLVAQLTLDGDAYRKALDELTRSHPDYPWAHLSRTFLDARSQDPEQRDAARADYDAFAALCPDRVREETQALVLIGDAEFARPRLGPLRRRALDSGQLGVLGTLWSLTLQAAPAEDREAARAKVQAEIAGLRTSAAGSGTDGLSALLEGYRALGDSAGEQWAADRILEVAPCSNEAAGLRPERLRARHPEPRDSAGREEWLRAMAADLDRAIASCPQDPRPLLEKIGLLAPDPAAPSAALLDAVDRFRALPQADGIAQPSLDTWTAAIYLQSGVRLDRVPGLLAEDRAALDRERTGKSGKSADALGYQLRQEDRLAADYALVTGDLDGARRSLRELDQEMAAAPRATSGRGGAVAGEGVGVLADRLDEPTRLDLLRYRLTAAEGRPEAALRMLAPLVADPALRPVAEGAARTAWRAVHGGSDGFAAWVAAASAGLAPDPSWRTVDEAPPDGSLVELGSGPWRWDDHRGTTLLVTAWASWCAPARGLLPSLGKLLEALGGRHDVEILTLNMDRTSGGMVSALDQLDGRIPVLAGGGALLGDRVPGVPVSWIVDGRGRVVRVRAGFDGDGDAWVAAALAAVRDVAGPAPAGAPSATGSAPSP